MKKQQKRAKIVEIIQKIREMPNRDDKIMSRIKLLDGGGVNRFEVIRLLDRLLDEIDEV